jgi:hypothetical protein
MATQVQLRRGNTSQTNAFTGAVAEITIDTDKNTVVVHDGSTPGGFALALESAQQDAQAFAKANAAFDKANSSYGQANTNAGNITVIQAVNVTQNTNINKIEGVNLTQNTSISNIEGVNLTQNTNITIAQNTGGSAFIQANLAFAAANNEAGVNLTQNTNITTAQNKADSAFNHANAAFDKANTGVASASNVTITTFATTANGAQTTFNLGWNPVSAETVIVTLDGVVQPDSSYSVSNVANTITFNTTPASGEAVRVLSLYSSACTNLYIIADGSVTTPKIADEAVTVSKLSQSTEEYILEKSIAMSIALG